MINELIIISAIVLFVDQMAAFLSRQARVQSVDLLIMHVCMSYNVNQIKSHANTFNHNAFFNSDFLYKLYF
jgi:hypothetical protein